MSNVRGAIKTDLLEQIRRQHAEIERLKAERDKAVKAEREACAKVIEAQDVDPAFKHRLAAAIRARGEVPK